MTTNNTSTGSYTCPLLVLARVSQDMQILASPAGVHDFANARKREMDMTITPNVTQAMAGSLVREYHGVELPVRLR